MSHTKQRRQETIKYWHEPVLGGIDLLTADCITHQFARHAHEEFVLAVFERGAEQFEAEGQQLTATRGSVLLIPPSIAHTGQAARQEGWSYRAFYPRLELFREVSSDTFRDKAPLEGLGVGLYFDSRLFNRLVRAHLFLSTNESGLDQAVELISAIRSFLTHALPCAVFKKPCNENRAISIAREFIDAHYSDPIGGVEIAAAVGLSLPHLMRAFFARMGVPINVYLNTVRLGHARRLLREGESAATTAVAVGFADQSHLIRRFREAYGVTPGQYVRDSYERVLTLRD